MRQPLCVIPARGTGPGKPHRRNRMPNTGKAGMFRNILHLQPEDRHPQARDVHLQAGDIHFQARDTESVTKTGLPACSGKQSRLSETQRKRKEKQQISPPS